MSNKKSNINYDDIFEEANIEPNEFLDFKSGNQKKNIIRLKNYLSQLEGNLHNTKKEVFAIIYMLDSFLEESGEKFQGENSDAMDKLSEVLECCSVIETQIEKIEDIKNEI